MLSYFFFSPRNYSQKKNLEAVNFSEVGRKKAFDQLNSSLSGLRFTLIDVETANSSAFDFSRFCLRTKNPSPIKSLKHMVMVEYITSSTDSKDLST